jgi:fibro-slime domain-containing protein
MVGLPRAVSRQFPETMMFARASRSLFFGLMGGLCVAIAACAKSSPVGGSSVFVEDAGVTRGADGAGPADDAGPGIALIDATSADATVDDACAADACDDTTTSAAVCGDGVIEAGELCDDGNAASGDGCSSTCQIEPGYTCMTPGQPCVPLVLCGNGTIDGTEGCDDGNTVSGDGCSSTCQIEPGWQCPVPGSSCTTICGDGMVVGHEQCDEGALNDGPADGGAGDGGSGDAGATRSGCSATCTIEPGFACAPPPTTPRCHPTVCGDGVKEGSEECDDHNLIPYDGCSPTCTLDPRCNGAGGCTGVCGDGLVFPGEQCDDGNTISGDGCSATCTIEPGFMCTTQAQPPAPTLVIPILYRDMLYFNTTAFPAPRPVGGGHPDFNRFGGAGLVTGLVQPVLGSDGEPLWASNGGGTMQTLTGPGNFCWWYHEQGCDTSGAGTAAAAGADAGTTANPYDALVYRDALGKPTTLTLTQGASGTYTYANPQFFPLDGLGWNAGTNPQLDTDCENQFTAGVTSGPRNFSFTSELHYVFTFQAVVAATNPAVFSFTGDDSVWAFINDKLVVDLGGVHNPATGTYILDTANAALLGLVDGGWYSIDVFQAEQHVCRSTYNLTLSNFAHVVSTCQSVCGDGIVAGAEQCDSGPNNVPVATAYGKGVCTTSCTVAPSCGDSVVEPQFGEQCDDGTNLAPYGGTSSTVCGPGCKFAPYCGDGILQSPPETCDNGASNVPTATAYGAAVCTTACVPAPFCGDGIVQAQFGEQCDGTANCNAACQTTGVQ